MSAFDGSQGAGMGAGVDVEEMLSQMFGVGGGMGGMGGMPFGGRPGPRKPRKGADDEQIYRVSLEDLYKGKTAKFSSKKNIICGHCKGSGGREKAKPKQCASCQGRGRFGGSYMIQSCILNQHHRYKARSSFGWPWPCCSRDCLVQLMQGLRCNFQRKRQMQEMQRRASC